MDPLGITEVHTGKPPLRHGREGTAVYGAGDTKIGVMMDRLSGTVPCGVELWRLSRNWRRPLSTALAVVEIRHQSWRLPHRRTDEGALGPRPQFAADCYGAYVRDPDGNKLHFVTRGN